MLFIFFLMEAHLDGRKTTDSAHVQCIIEIFSHCFSAHELFFDALLSRNSTQVAVNRQNK